MLSVDTDSTTDDNEDASPKSLSPSIVDASKTLPLIVVTESTQEPIDLSKININADLQKAAEQNLAKSMKNLKFSSEEKPSEKSPEKSPEKEEKPEKVEDGTLKFENTAERSIGEGGQEKATMLENLQASAKHNFDKGSHHNDDDDDDDDGESKVCLKCKEDFITYSGKDHCPPCR